MPDDPGPWPAEVTVRGGAQGPVEPRRRSFLRPLAVAAAALVVVAGIAFGRQRPPPAPRCPEPCLPPGSLVVGAALPVTGVLAASGTAQQQGLQRALERVNAEGGLDVGGKRRRVELLVRDTRSEPDVAGQDALVLVRGPYRVVGLIGPCAPPVALVRVAESRGVPLLTGCQPLPPIGPAPLRHTWQVAPDEAEQAAAVLSALRASPGRRTGLFLTNDRSEVPWTDAAGATGTGLVGIYRPQGREWAAAVAQAVQDRVDVVVAVTQAPTGITLWQELQRQGLRPLSAYASEAGIGTAWRTAVGPAGDGTLTDLVRPVAGPPARPAAVDEALSAVSAELAEVLLDGLRRAGGGERADLDAALRGASAEVAGRPVQFAGDHTSRLPVRLARWRDGRLVPGR